MPSPCVLYSPPGDPGDVLGRLVQAHAGALDEGGEHVAAERIVNFGSLPEGGPKCRPASTGCTTSCRRCRVRQPGRQAAAAAPPAGQRSCSSPAATTFSSAILLRPAGRFSWPRPPYGSSPPRSAGAGLLVLRPHPSANLRTLPISGTARRVRQECALRKLDCTADEVDHHLRILVRLRKPSRPLIRLQRRQQRGLMAVGVHPLGGSRACRRTDTTGHYGAARPGRRCCPPQPPSQCTARPTGSSG